MGQADYILGDEDTIKIRVIRQNWSQDRELVFREFKRQLFQGTNDGKVWRNVFIPSQSLGLSGFQATPAPSVGKFTSDTTRGIEYAGISAVALDKGWQNVEFNMTLPSDYAEGTDVNVVLQCIPTGESEGKDLLLEVEYIWLNRNEAQPVTTTIETLNHTLVDVGTLVEIPVATLHKSNAEIGSLLACRISRIIKDPSWTHPDLTDLVNDNYTGVLHVLAVGVSYKADSLGSNLPTDKQLGAPRT